MQANYITESLPFIQMKSQQHKTDVNMLHYLFTNNKSDQLIWEEAASSPLVTNPLIATMHNSPTVTDG